MPIDRTIAQLIVLLDRNGPAVVAKSDNVPFAWENSANTAAVRYGSRPVGMKVPEAIFAVPLGKGHVAVANVIEINDSLAFRFLLLNRKLYEALGDPFQIADRFLPEWNARGALPLLEWPLEPLPARKVEDLQAMMKANDGPFLLGATQALLDGSRIMLQRGESDAKLLRNLWQLLPTKSRSDIWPATFAFSEELGFQIVAMPSVPEKLPWGYLSEEQTRDYPEGRYELSLQTAIESGNQFELDRLLARRSSQETLRLAAMMLGFAIVLAVLSKLVF
jgi:hypothetical protein